MGSTHELSDAFYALERIHGLVESGVRLCLHPDVEERIRRGAELVDRLVRNGDYIYGVTSGFGSLCETPVELESLSELQHNHLMSHACGVGSALSPREARLVLLVKLLTLRSGRTGATPVLVQRLLDFWNHDLIPVVPRKGTVGASGDLAPLAHLGLPVIGLGQVYQDGKIVATPEALASMGWEPLLLRPKEGLALTNGVQYINALAVDSLVALGELLPCADLVAALSVQAFGAARDFYDPLYHSTSHHPERMVVALNLTRLLEGSNHHELVICRRSRQDPYSFRCLPQVHAAVRQAVGFARSIVERDCNGCSDNPLFFAEEDRVLMGGNLHGESTALSLDFAAMAASELASISERRTYQLLSGQQGLPDYLVARPGVNSGLMIAQYTSAALVNENKVLASPASVDSIPTSQLQEDHVSMGGTSAYKLAQVVENLEYVLGIELMTASQAAELQPGLRLSAATASVFDDVRCDISFLERDRVLAPDMEAARQLVRARRRDWLQRLGIA